MHRRVLLVDKAGGLGGSTISLYQLVRGLNKSRFEPVVLLADSNPYVERFRALGVEVVARPWANRPLLTPARWRAVRDSDAVQAMRRFRLGRKVYHAAGFYVKQLPKILERAEEFADLLNQVRPDFVHFNDGVPFNRGEILGSRWTRVPILCHVRAFEPLNRFDRLLAPGIRRYVFISQAIADWFLSTGVKIKAWDTVLNGIDLDEIGPLPEARPAVRQEIGLPQDAYVAAIVGRLTPWKGQETFLGALESVAPDHLGLWGLVVGDSDPQFGGFERDLRARAETGPMKGRLIFAGLRLDINRVLAAVDVLVHASLEPEPFGRVVLEGMAAGVPVVAAAAGAIPEIITHGRTGLLFSPGDEKGLGLEITRLMGARPLAEQLVANARREVESRFAIGLHVTKMEAIYEGMS